MATRYSVSEWRAALNQSFIPMDISVEDDNAFSATMRSRTLNGIRIFDVTANAHVASRAPHNVAQDDVRVFGITVQLEGTSTISQDGVESLLEPGDFAIYDSTRPFERRFESDYRNLILRFPQYMISLPPHTLTRLTATRLGAEEGLGVVVSPFLAEVAKNLEELEGWTGVLVAHTMIDLVSAALGEKLALVGTGTPGGHTEAFLAACDFGMQNLAEPGLNPDSIAAACFISVRLLHKIFHGEKTTVSQWIRERRLEQCRRELSDPHQRNRSVGDIASAWGIHDGAHFSRIFRTAYGASPRDYRRTQMELVNEAL